MAILVLSDLNPRGSYNLIVPIVSLQNLGGQSLYIYNAILELFHGFYFIILTMLLHKDFSQSSLFNIMVC